MMEAALDGPELELPEAEVVDVVDDRPGRVVGSGVRREDEDRVEGLQRRMNAITDEKKMIGDSSGRRTRKNRVTRRRRRAAPPR